MTTSQNNAIWIQWAVGLLGAILFALIMAMVGSITELQRQVAALSAKVAVLENAVLKKRVEQDNDNDNQAMVTRRS